MYAKNVKLSNYVGQVKEEDKDSVNDHLVNIDKDLQNLRIETNNLIRYVRGQTWEDINIGAMSLGRGATAPTNIQLSSTNIMLAGFSGGATADQVYGTIEVIHSYKEGSNISPHLHWFPSTNGTGNVRWQLEYVISDPLFSAISSSTTITVDSSATGIAWKEVRPEFPDIVGTGLKIGNQLSFRLFRNPADAADTYGDVAAVLTLGFHIQQNSLGSTSEWIK